MGHQQPQQEEPKVILETDSFWAGFRNQRVVEDVSITIPQHGVTAIIGPSGCGKSTLIGSLNRISELKPDYCWGGSIKFQGKDIHGKEMDVDELRKRIGLIFQKPTPFPLSVYSNLEIPLREHFQLAADELSERIDELLTMVGLVEEMDSPHTSKADELSGGQQQRLCIARAMTLSPDVLLCDEPCSSLDPIAGERVEKLLLSLSQSISVVIVTHNLAQARRMADQVLFFCSEKGGAGRLVEQGSAEAIFENPSSELTKKYVSGSFG